MTFNTEFDVRIVAQQDSEIVLEMHVSNNGFVRLTNGSHADKSRRCVDGFTIETLKQLIAEHERISGGSL
jgi:hypothetical protein